MRSWTAAPLIAAGVGLAGCGGGTHFADRSRPATPVNLSAYVNDRQVSVAPSKVGAGPMIVYVTSAASRTELVTIVSASGKSLATTGPINPGSNAQVEVDLATGSYTVRASAAHSGALVGAPKPAHLRVGAPRPSSNNSVQQP